MWFIVSKAEQTSFEGGIGASDRRSNFVVPKPCKIKPWSCNITCKNCARRTTCNGRIVKCRNDHSSKEIHIWKEHRSSTIKKPRSRRSYNKKAQKCFTCEKNTWITQPKTRKKKIGARRSYINRARMTSHVERTLRSCIIESRKMKIEE